jgi:short-subunit dehydrogenase
MKSNVLITGCSTGIGLETALYLHSKGYEVFATVRKEDDVEHLRRLGLQSFLLDVTKLETINKAFEDILAITDGKLDIVFNNAGFGQPGAVEDISVEVLKEQFETNVFGLHQITLKALDIMKTQGYGKIIQHSSVLGLVSLKLRGAYNASKYAVEGLTDTLRLELNDTNIDVTLLNTGPVTSDFRKNAIIKAKENLNIEKIIITKKVKPRYYITKATYLLGYLKRALSTKALDRILIKI